MQHITKYLNVPLIETHLVELYDEQKQLTRKKTALRQQIYRIRKLIESHQQLELHLQED